MRKILKYIPVWTLSVLATLTIVYLLLDKAPVGNELLLFKGADKVAHMIAFAGLTMIYIFDYIRYRLPHHTRLDVEMAFAAASAALGGLLEIAQLVMDNGRTYELADWGADIVGSIIGYLIMKFLLIRPIRHYLLHYRHHSHHSHHKRHSHN